MENLVTNGASPRPGTQTSKAPREQTSIQIKKVGVIGAGQMGNGIAHVAALSGYDVRINDLAMDRVEQAVSLINGNLGRQVSKGKLTEQQRAEAIGRIKAAPGFDAFADADLVIEAASEDVNVKRKIFTALCPHLKPERDPGDQHVVDLHHPAGRLHRPAREVHGHALHEPGAAHGAGRDDPRHRHRRRDL